MASKKTVESFQFVKSVFIVYIKTTAFSIRWVYILWWPVQALVWDITFASSISDQTALISWKRSCLTLTSQNNAGTELDYVHKYTAKNLAVNVLDHCVEKQHFFIVCVLKALYFL